MNTVTLSCSHKQKRAPLRTYWFFSLTIGHLRVMWLASFWRPSVCNCGLWNNVPATLQRKGTHQWSAGRLETWTWQNSWDFRWFQMISDDFRSRLHAAAGYLHLISPEHIVIIIIIIILQNVFVLILSGLRSPSSPASHMSPFARSSVRCVFVFLAFPRFMLLIVFWLILCVSLHFNKNLCLRPSPRSWHLHACVNELAVRSQ